MSNQGIKFRKKVVSKVKELREEKEMSQEELANKIGVTRQTIYYIEKGQYNPKLTLSFNISTIFNKPIEEIFKPEPIIKEVLAKQRLEELKELAKVTNIKLERIIELENQDDSGLSDNFNLEELEHLSKALGNNFDDFFIVVD